MFDCAVDNLIDNALAKRQQQPGISIRVLASANPPRIRICDSGAPVPPHMARQLLNTVVRSENGLGVGLYQAARWATQLGYRMTLLENREGGVCFELEQVMPAADSE
jgi:C4-dicarboxylate-specific signal transduction histidine kinase